MSAEGDKDLARHQRTLLLLGCVLFVLPLLLFAWTGTSMRYSGDDYCYAGLFRQLGFWDTVRTTYLGSAPFHGNRYSLTLASGLADLFGPTASAALPALALAVWVAGLAYAIKVGAGSVARRFPAGWAWLAAGALIFFSLALTPELAQSLYWRSGMLPYLMPLVMFTGLVGLLLVHARRGKPPAWRLGVIALLALFAGGISETATAVQLTLLTLAMSGFWLARRSVGERHSYLLAALGAAWMGTAVAQALLFLSPSAASRLAESDPTGSILELAQLSGYHTYLFLNRLATRHTLANLGLFGLFLWLGALLPVNGRQSQGVTWKQVVVAIWLIGIAWLTVVVASMAPSAYAQSSYPVGRALIIPHFMSSLAIAAIGGLLGNSVAARWRPSAALKGVIGLFLLGAIGVFPVTVSLATWSELGSYRRWSSFWDVRDQQIREARDRGDSELEVILLDKIIPDVAELQPDPDFWYNNCAEWYYDIDHLSASLPGWDE